MINNVAQIDFTSGLILSNDLINAWFDCLAYQPGNFVQLGSLWKAMSWNWPPQ
jgi:hypothetical protein